ncbi:DUF1461 domain-containing protein [Sinanaerobacter chloroacetimidivorans]|nr:DUF1461 domain-containing protein [Sinanaerobacter chloroacetimidivorans]
MLILLIICIPLISITGAYNIVLRMPDLYVYEFNRVQLTDELELELKDEEFGHFFSDFMIGKVENFELIADYQGKEQNVFHTMEQVSMEHFKQLLNILLYAFAGMLLIAVICYGVFMANNRKYFLRTAFKSGILVYLVMIILPIITYLVPSLRDFMQQFIFRFKFNEDNLLTQIFTESFVVEFLAATTFISAVILFITGSVTWRMTKPRRMFW